MILECEKSLGFLYFYAGRPGEAKISLERVIEFESKDVSEDRYARHWYGEAWHALGRIYHNLGDDYNEKYAFTQALVRGFR
jgi:hypothetical protein